MTPIFKCFMTHEHEWNFYYNYGMPLGISTEQALRMLTDHTSFAVYVCRCKRQARKIGNTYIILSKEEEGNP
jgi:hypothetical protein